MGFVSEARVHGGIRLDELKAHGVSPESVLDLSVNLNPYGPPAALVEACRNASLSDYPDPTGAAAREAWALRLEVSPTQIVVGHGAADLFWAITRALISAQDRVLILEPTFSELRIACEQAGARVERVFADAAQGFTHTLSQVAERARGARLVYLCSPNNPTGACVSLSELAELARTLPETLFVLDQSFLSMSEQAEALFRPLPHNVLAVRSLTKDFCLPGLRIGLVQAASEWTSRIEAVRPSWATSAPALAAIEAAASELPFVAESYRKLRVERQRMALALEQAGLRPLPSETVFHLVEVNDAASFRRQLLMRGVLVRDASSFGLPGHVRIAVRTPEATEKLVHALRGMG